MTTATTVTPTGPSTRRARTGSAATTHSAPTGPGTLQQRSGPRAAPPAAGRLQTATRLVLGEWIKLRSLRSTWWTLAAGLLGMLGIGLALTLTAEAGVPVEADGEPSGLASLGGTGLSLAGYQFTQLAVATLGVLLVTSEYTSGSIRATFAAVPTRWPTLAAKAGALVALLLPAALLTALVTFLAGQLALGDAGASLRDPGTARVVLGTALFLTALGLLGSALGWLIRHTAGAVTAVLALVFLVPVFGGLLPDRVADLLRYLPVEAGASVLQPVAESGAFAPWTGLAVLCGWLAVGFASATVVVRRRDA